MYKDYDNYRTYENDDLSACFTSSLFVFRITFIGKNCQVVYQNTPLYGAGYIDIPLWNNRHFFSISASFGCCFISLVVYCLFFCYSS